MVAAAFRGASRPRHFVARPPTAASRLAHQAASWLRADPREVVRFARRAAPAVSPLPPTGRGVLHTPAGGEGLIDDLYAGLGAWQRTIARWRLVAVLRRWALSALALALLLAGLDRLTSTFTLRVEIVAAPAVLLVAGIALTLRRPLSLATVARVLDHHLALKEQVASALEAPGSTNALLGPRLQARAAALVGRTRREWVAYPVAAEGEWAGLAVASALLALVLIAPGPASTRPALPAVRHVGTAPASGAPATVSSRAHLPVQVRAAVVSTPPAGMPEQRRGTQRQNVPSVTRRGRGRTQENRAGHRVAGAATPVGRGARTGAAGQAKASPARRGAPTSFAAGQRHNLPLVSASGRHTSVPPPGHTGTAAAGSARGRQGSSTAPGPNGVARPGAVRKGSRPSNGRSAPSARTRPGAVAGKALSGSAHTPGSNAAGHGRAPAQSRPSSRHPLPTMRGRQLALRSAYAGAPRGGQQRPGPRVPQARGDNTAHAGSGQGEAQATDYIPPDANAVAPGDRAVVVGYFTPRGTS